MKQDYEETKAEYDALRKQFTDSQTLNSQSKKQIDKLQNDLDEQIRSNERFHVATCFCKESILLSNSFFS